MRVGAALQKSDPALVPQWSNCTRTNSHKLSVMRTPVT